MGRMGVALHPEGVDRNCTAASLMMVSATVALHPEGVDRNFLASSFQIPPSAVALHPEGVDRNTVKNKIIHERRKSPSTRRVWIEIIRNKQTKR